MGITQASERIGSQGPAGADSGRGELAGKTVASVGSVLAAIGATSCCVIPFALVSLGIGGAWLGNLTALAPYQNYFIALTAIFLAGGFYLVYRRPKAACADGSYCARPRSHRITKVVLWSATALVIPGAGFPYVAPLLFDL
jgi:mercuric ion transport protein